MNHDTRHRHGRIQHDPKDCTVCRLGDRFNRLQNNLYAVAGLVKVLWGQYVSGRGKRD